MFLAVLVLALAACGGEADDANGADNGSSSSTGGSDDGGDDGGDSFTVSDGGGEVVVGSTTGRPDWLPAWVELPNGLEITTQFNSPGTGEAAVLGIVEGESQDELLAEALILVQSSGYAIGEQYDSINGKGFEAENGIDGSRIVFGVSEFVEGSSTWSMEFYELTDVGDGDEQVANEPSTSRYDLPGVMTVSVGTQMFDVVGSCEFGDGYGTFAADDARSVFDVFGGAGPGGLGAVGSASLIVDGEVTTSWSVDQSMEVTKLELTDNSIVYEGGIRENAVGAEPESGAIVINCG